ncbi:hypothetical protein SCP_1800990 [Sparassis crispa]|uniref:F-box domain-containing protein n=1 Tax=Sparassis crispa TaxID=139825 RepID=A0A401H6K5_9APHY|nr:hypothetical protein SCP_1800990 [Sparassis crispa]GBE90077.1 hypothetical protein SCP_1800990 [Sparassis crispa]
MNAVCRINQFPIEILGLIFHFALDPLEEEYEIWPVSESSMLSTTELVNITLVCHLWHDIAIGTPSLWTTFSKFNHVPYTTALQRSRNALLKVQIDYDAAKTFYDMFISDTTIRRIQELHVYLLDISEYPRARCFCFPTPNLERLSLLEVESPKDDTRPLLFHGDTPRLTSLLLDTVGFLPSNRFEVLTQLSIRSLYSSPETPITLLDVTAFLSGCPRLEELMIDEFAVGMQSRNATLHVPSLAYLRRMTIDSQEAGMALASWLMTHAHRSEGVAVRILDQHSFPLQSDFSSTYGTSFKGLHTLDVRMGYQYEWNLIATAFNDVSGIRVERPYSHERPFLLRDWPLAHVRELHIRGSEDVREGTGFETLLSPLVSLTSLVVHLDYPCKKGKPSVLHVLATPCNSQLLCPNLATMRIIAEHASVVEGIAEGGASAVDDIIALAMIRAEYKHSLHAIVLEFAWRHEDMLMRLKALDA